MKIERLLYQVRPAEFAKDFLQADAQVWTPWLQRQKGFLNKTTRIMPQGQIELLIFWASAEDKTRAEGKKQELKQVENLMKSRAPGVYHLVQSSTLKAK
jgi:uncharacterized protein (TIGR03792 family)